MGVDDVHRIRVVLETLGHLLPILGQDQAVDDNILERRSSKQVVTEDC
jgi:hypothetical protein